MIHICALFVILFLYSVLSDTPECCQKIVQDYEKKIAQITKEHEQQQLILVNKHEQEMQELHDLFASKTEQWHSKLKFVNKLRVDYEKQLQHQKQRADNYKKQLVKIQKFVHKTVKLKNEQN